MSSAAPLPFRPPPEAPKAGDSSASALKSANDTPSPARARLRAAANARRLAALDDQKRSFLRMVSHELRTPLNAIIGFSEIIACELYGPLGAPQYREYAEHVRTSGHKLLRLVNQVLEIARLEGHALDLAIGSEPLDHAVEDALLALREEIAAHGAEITVINADDPEAPLPPVMADARGLRTLLVNLLQNAVVHGASSPVVLRVVRVGGDVQLSVEDSGPGVPADAVSKLIRPFEHAETVLTRGDGGAGLGLPIVHLLCHAMGATLKLRSAKGEGFTATVTLAGA